MRKEIEKYLNIYAEDCAPKIAKKISILSNTQFCRCVVIPAYAEDRYFMTCLASLEAAAQEQGAKVLVLLVVNQREDSPAGVETSNLKVMRQLASYYSRSQRINAYDSLYEDAEKKLSLFIYNGTPSQRHFPVKQGVGLARKIGSDLAIALYFLGVLASPWIANTDADVIVSRDYFSQLPKNKDKHSCFLYPFKHRTEDCESSHEIKAIKHYESFLRYYEDGLRHAGSPYAFQTVGSTLLFHALHYAKVRGFPKKQAGEDFYFLNKMAKMGQVEELSVSPISLSGRPSNRVPFGTGASVTRISQDLVNGGAYTVYHPLSFTWLKEWIEFAKYLMQTEKPEYLANFSDHRLNTLIEEDGYFDMLHTIYHKSPRVAQRLNHFHIWFDAFRTMKFMHKIRDRFLPEVDADSLPFVFT